MHEEASSLQARRRRGRRAGGSGSEVPAQLRWNNTCPLVKHMMGHRLEHQNTTCGFPSCPGAGPSSETTILCSPGATCLCIQGSFNFHPKTAAERRGAAAPLAGAGCAVLFFFLFLFLVLPKCLKARGAVWDRRCLSLRKTRSTAPTPNGCQATRRQGGDVEGLGRTLWDGGRWQRRVVRVTWGAL